MPTTQITFNVNDRQARASFSRLKREVDRLEQEFDETGRGARSAGEAIDTLGDRSRETAREIAQANQQLREFNEIAKLRESIPAAPVDSYARSVDALQEEFNQLQIAIGERLLPVVGSASQGLTELFDNITNFIQGTNEAKQSVESLATALKTATTASAVNQAFQDRITFLQQEKAALDAAAEGRANYFRFRGHDTEAGVQYRELTTELEALQAAQGDVAAQSQYLRTVQAQLQAQARTLHTEIAALRGEQEALNAETAGTEAYNTRQTQIFERNRQRAQAEQQINTENRRVSDQITHRRIELAREAREVEVQGFQDAARQGAAYADELRAINRQQEAFLSQVAALPNVNNADAQYGNFTAHLRSEFEQTEQQGRSLLQVMQEIAAAAFGTDLSERIPDTIVRDAGIDQRIADEARGQQTLTDIRQAAAEQGRQFLNRALRREERDIQRSLNDRTRTYRQFANLVSGTFINLATGRTQSFEQVANAFIQQSIRIGLRALVAFQLQKRLDDSLTASKIANLQKVAAAQSVTPSAAGGAGGLGGLPGLGNLPAGLGSSLAGGGAALGVSALLFPQEIRNLTSGIADTIGGFLSNVSAGDAPVVPERQQILLKIGDNEVKDITNIQSELRQEGRV